MPTVSDLDPGASLVHMAERLDLHSGDGLHLTSGPRPRIMANADAAERSARSLPGVGVSALAPPKHEDIMSNDDQQVKRGAWLARAEREVWGVRSGRHGSAPLDTRGLSHAGPACPRLVDGAGWGWAGARAGDVLLPTYDHKGGEVGARLWQQGGARLAPSADTGLATTGAVLLNGVGVAWWRDGETPEAVLICEGEPDWLTACIIAPASGLRVAVIGIYSGAWSAEMGARFAELGEGARVGILCDRDKAGERYAATIRQSLPAHVEAYRWGADVDVNDLWRKASDVDVTLEALLSGPDMPAAPSTELTRWDWTDAQGWTEHEGWADARQREMQWAAAQERAATQGVEAGDAHTERARKWARTALERSVEFLRGAEGDRVGVLRALAPVASMVKGGALDGLEVRQVWTTTYVTGDRNTRADRALLIRDVLNYPKRQATTLEDIARTLAAQDGEKATARKAERKAGPAVDAKAEEVRRKEARAAAWRADVDGRAWGRIPSEAEIARRLIDYLTPPDDEGPVGDEDSLWRYDGSAGLWREVTKASVTRIISAWDGAPIDDKRSIKIDAKTPKAARTIAIDLQEREGFMSQAPCGVMLRDGFLAVDTLARKVEIVPASREHRARHKLDAMPTDKRSDLLATYLASAHEGEDAADKVRLMGEVLFVALTGLGTTYKKAVLAYGEAGGGKSQWLELLGGLVPKSATSTVEPQRMSEDYHCAALAGKTLNVVAELEGEEILKEGRFKGIVHGEKQQARNPAGRVFSVVPRALHVFASNSLPSAPGASGAYWDRWLVMGFTKRWTTKDDRTLLKGGVAEIGKRILAEDMGGLLGWVIDCGRDLVARGHYTIPATSRDLLNEWKGSGDNVAGWLEERARAHTQEEPRNRWANRSAAYRDYVEWARNLGFGTLNASNFKLRLKSLGVRCLRSRGGYLFSLDLLGDIAPPDDASPF